ncbi:helix-turn-helix domain-containing protein [Streptomyces luteolus]|uniref:Helix-turn-helix transcriptional regulator n=1 Tax=Streptomyces luteolus TaxID=3043615 RepID=A0ABT6SVS5_9ACTN|nr:helix-turn-helix transcriptional regulator [Streptomyces sp. B-S-A12]MDI3419495.1 helix-turn-helix transcriptional regulator [Streptomyces sp. B-S-A12]
MQSSPFSSVQAARESLGARLRDLRLDAGLTMQQLADRCAWSKSKVSRIEAARTAPSDADIRHWCRASEVEDQAADLIAASRSADSMYVEWRRMERTGMRRLQESAVPLYERTKLFRVYASRVVPGLLQTEGYAGALLAQIAEFRNVPDDSSQAAAVRVDRSHVIRSGQCQVSLLIEEDVLFYQFGDVSTMAGQLGYLLTALSYPAVAIGVIPRTAPRTMWGQETFTMFDDTRVHVELLNAKVTITTPGEVDMYRRAFGKLGEMAVYGQPARALITHAIDSLG